MVQGYKVKMHSPYSLLDMNKSLYDLILDNDYSIRKIQDKDLYISD